MASGSFDTSRVHDAARNATDESLAALVSRLEHELDKRGWDYPASLLAIVDPLVLNLLMTAAGQEVDAEERGHTVLGATTVSAVAEPPYEALRGLKAPDWAIGMMYICEAWSYPDGVSAEMARITLPTDYPNPGEVREVTAVLRDGRTFHLEHKRGREASFTETDTRNIIVACLQRSMDLPTAVVDVPMGALVGRFALETCVAALQRAAEGDVVAAEDSGHDAIRVVDGVLYVGSKSLDLMSIPDDAGIPQTGWEALREAATRGELTGFPAEDARWMDVPMFARCALSSFQPVRSSLETIEAIAGPDVAAELEAWIRASGWADSSIA